MIRIHTKDDRNIEEICNFHFRTLEPIINEKIVQLKLSKALSICQADFINSNLSTILKGKSADLIKVNNEYEKYCNIKRCKNVTKGLSSVFDYRRFSDKKSTQYNAYILANKLNVRVCPYCNRQYTFTVIFNKKNIIRPEFDHFFLRKNYPLLALSFYNLIPSCKYCNSSLKGQKVFNQKKNLNPYEEDFGDVNFNYEPEDVNAILGLNSNIKIIIDPNENGNQNSKIKEHLNIFKIEEIYQGHTDIVLEIIRKFNMSDGRYLESLLTQYPSIDSYDEVYRLAFGNYYNDKDLCDRPLSKLTRDIFNRFDFIMPIEKMGSSLD